MEKKYKPEIEDLINDGNYKLVKILKHDEVVHFVVQQIKQLRWPMLLFYTFILVLFILIAGLSFLNFFNPLISWGSYWIYMLFGFLSGMLLVIPFHEALHGLAYRLAGAKKINYGMDLKQMLFYASAPGFVADKKNFIIVALFPFVIINIVFATVIVFGQTPLQWASLVAIFVHSTLCIGDFAMINYMALFPDKKMYTYDDQIKKTSFFFITTLDY